MTLRVNSRGAQVSQLQRQLKAAGFNPGPVDGIFGQGTLKAVKAYQKSKGLAVDGIVGPQTQGKLLGTSAPPKVSGTTAPGGKTVTGYVNGRAKQITVAPVGNGKYLRTDAAAAYNRMKAAAKRAGVDLTIVSGFRTNAQQKSLYAAYKAGRGNLAAPPGYSNHQGGLSADISVGTRASKAYKWLAQNARAYGFVNDVRSEPWHWTYRG